MVGGVTRRMLPHLSGVPHLHVNRPLLSSLVQVSPYSFRYVNTLSEDGPIRDQRARALEGCWLTEEFYL